jgi:hypothetical protein
LIHGASAAKGVDLENAAAAAEEVYLASLPWIRGQAATAPAGDRQTAGRASEMVKPVAEAVETSAAMIGGSSVSNITQAELAIKNALLEKDSVSDAGRRFDTFEQLTAAVKELQVAVSVKG